MLFTQDRAGGFGEISWFSTAAQNDTLIFTGLNTEATKDYKDLLGAGVEFIIVSGAGVSAQDHALQAACETAPRLASVDGPYHYLTAPGVFVAGARPLRNSSQTYFWDGHGVCENTAFSSGTHWAPKPHMLDHYVRSSLDGLVVNDMRGTYSILAFDAQSGVFSVTLDPLSQYSVFVYQRGSIFVASNNIYLIEAVANVLGNRLTRSIEAGCFEVAASIGGGTRTGFAEVSVLDFGHMITGRGHEHAIAPSNLKAVPDGLDYNQLLEKSAERLTGYVAALDGVTGADGLLFDLTGGQDSRLCFAAAVGAGVKDLNFFVGGDEGDDDMYVARLIAKAFGAKEGNFPDNYVESSIDGREMARRATFRQQGHSNLYHYSLGTARLPGVCRVRGGAGEIARSHLDPMSTGSLFGDAPVKFLRQLGKNDPFYRQALTGYWRGIFNEQQRSAARWAFKFSNSIRSQQSLYTREFKQYAVQSLQKDLAHHAETNDSMGMDLYFKDRTRRHFAYLTRAMNFSLGAFEPLYDPYLLAAAQALDWHDRASGKLVFDLIERMAGRRLLEIPFAAKSLQTKPRAHLAARLGRDPKSLSAVDHNTMPVVDPAKILSAGSIDQWADYDGPEGFGNHAKYLWQNRSYMRELAVDLPHSHACWGLLQRDEFLHAVNSDEYFYAKSNKATRGLRFLHLLIWINGDESQVGISEIIS